MGMLPKRSYNMLAGMIHTHTHTHCTISASQSPLRVFIRDESVSIFFTFHFLTSSGVAVREVEPKTCSTSSGSPSGYACEGWETHGVSMATLWLTPQLQQGSGVCCYLVEFVQYDPLVAPVVDSIGDGLQVVLQRLNDQTGVKLRHVVGKRKHVTVNLNLRYSSNRTRCFYRRWEKNTPVKASEILHMLC